MVAKECIYRRPFHLLYLSLDGNNGDRNLLKLQAELEQSADLLSLESLDGLRDYLESATRSGEDSLCRKVHSFVLDTLDQPFIVHPPGKMKGDVNLDWAWSSNVLDPVELAGTTVAVGRMARRFWEVADEVAKGREAVWIWQDLGGSDPSDFGEIYTSPPWGFLLDGKVFALSESLSHSPGEHWLDAHSGKRGWFAAVKGLQIDSSVVFDDVEVCMVVAIAMDDEAYVVLS